MTNDARPPHTEIEAMAKAICQSGKLECGQGCCSLLCMDQLGDVRKKGCHYAVKQHGDLAASLLRTLASAAPVPPDALAWLDRTIVKYRLAPEGAHARAIREALSVSVPLPTPIRSRPSLSGSMLSPKDHFS